MIGILGVCLPETKYSKSHQCPIKVARSNDLVPLCFRAFSVHFHCIINCGNASLNTHHHSDCNLPQKRLPSVPVIIVFFSPNQRVIELADLSSTASNGGLGIRIMITMELTDSDYRMALFL